MRLTKRDVAEIAALLALFLALVAAAVLFPRNGSGRDLHSTWPESAEFSQLMGGQERFSEHETNIGGVTIVVDHETGNQYLCTPEGVTGLTDADGTPLRVWEATDDGED